MIMKRLFATLRMRSMVSRIKFANYLQGISTLSLSITSDISKYLLTKRGYKPCVNSSKRR